MNTSPSLILKELQKEDLQPIISTFVFPWNNFKIDAKKWNRYYQEQQMNLRVCCLVKWDHEYIGYGSLLKVSEYPSFKELNIPEICDVRIINKYQGKGFGKKLIEQLEIIASQNNYKQIGIGFGLYKDYGFAQKLYVKMGYVPDGNGVTYKGLPVRPGDSYPFDDDLTLWLKKDLNRLSS